MSAAKSRPMDAVEPPFARARAHAAGVEGKLSSTEMIRSPHSDVETLCEAQGREWARLMLEEHLALRAAQEKRVEVTGEDGVARTAVRDSERHLETVVGTVAVPRKAYQAAGCSDLHPMDATLNLPRELFSYGVRKLVAKEVARASFDDVVEMARDFCGAVIAKRQVEELAVRAAQDFEAFYEQRQPAHEPTEDLLVLSTDAKGIAMRHEDLRDATRLAAEKKVNKLETRLAPGEKKNRKRMAQVATVYSVAPWPRAAMDLLRKPSEQDEPKRPRPHDKRVWASVEKHPRTVIRAMFDEAQRRDPDHLRRWIVLVDGEPKQLAAVKAEARRVTVKVTILADVVHVVEYIWKAARALFGESTPRAEEWVHDRLLALLTGRSGGEIAHTIRWWASRRKLSDAAGEAIDTACGYLSDRKRTRLLKYAEALRDGLPIATGAIEGACRYLVKDRMDKTGARWSLTGAEAVLRLRAVRASGDFDAYWQFHLAREKERNHGSRYADGEIPDPLPAPKPRLKRVK
jgi:hypothetical protein